MQSLDSLDPENAALRDHVYPRIEARYKPMVYRRTAKGKAPRPPNMFVLWRLAAVGVLPRALKGTSALSKLWNNAPSERKLFWKARAAEEVARHRTAFPRYRYRPKKRSAEGTSDEEEDQDNASEDLAPSPSYKSVAIQTSPPASPVSFTETLRNRLAVNNFLGPPSSDGDEVTSMSLAVASSDGYPVANSFAHTPSNRTSSGQSMIFSDLQPSLYSAPNVQAPIQPTFQYNSAWPSDFTTATLAMSSSSAPDVPSGIGAEHPASWLTNIGQHSTQMLWPSSYPLAYSAIDSNTTTPSTARPYARTTNTGIGEAWFLPPRLWDTTVREGQDVPHEYLDGYCGPSVTNQAGLGDVDLLTWDGSYFPVGRADTETLFVDADRNLTRHPHANRFLAYYRQLQV